MRLVSRKWFSRMVSVATTCRRCIYYFCKLVAWVPVLFVTLLLIWGYYVYVYIINLSGSFTGVTDSPALSVIMVVFILVSAHILFSLQITSYIRTIITKHKKVPEEFFLTDDQLEELDKVVDEQELLQELAKQLPVNQFSRGGGVRYCDSCEMIKPDRCHHCSVCNRCILKMDHHCPWVNNCVGFSNYKFFVLFLFYSVLLCLWLCITGLNSFIIAWSTNSSLKPAHKFQVIIWYFVCSMFGLSTAVLFSFHVYLLLYNKTTLENMQSPYVPKSHSHRPYFITFRRNLEQVLGKNCFLAILPVSTSEGDGTVYPLLVTPDDNSTSNSGDSDSELTERDPIAQTHV